MYTSLSVVFINKAVTNYATALLHFSGHKPMENDIICLSTFGQTSIHEHNVTGTTETLLLEQTVINKNKKKLDLLNCYKQK
jgi:hypothetical protein